MKVIHKERLKMTANPQVFNVPRGSIVRKFAFQDDQPTIWIEKPVGVPDNDKIAVQMVGTGHPEINDDGIYVDSVLVGAYVWHLYRLF